MIKVKCFPPKNSSEAVGKHCGGARFVVTFVLGRRNRWCLFSHQVPISALVPLVTFRLSDYNTVEVGSNIVCVWFFNLKKAWLQRIFFPLKPIKKEEKKFFWKLFWPMRKCALLLQRCRLL